MSGNSPQPRVSFGAFEVNPASGELRKSGIHIKLHDKPFQILLALLEHTGEVVTRKELQKRLWPQDTFVEFENGLNNAIGRLREALGDTADTPHFIETIPRRGYRFIAEVAPKSSTQKRVSSRQWIIGAGIAIVITVAVGLAIRLNRANAAPIRSLAVLPFRDLRTGTQGNYFAAGMTDAVTTELARLGVSKVTSETSAEKFQNTKESVPQIARTLGVDAIVEGAVLQEGDRVRITVQLIRGSTDQHLWAQSYERQMSDILALQDGVALGVARAIDLKLSPGRPETSDSRKRVNSAAYEDYLEGRYYMQKRDDEYDRGKDYFERAIQLDPNFAAAYASLSQYYLQTERLSPTEALTKGREYAEDALRLDPDSTESHLSLAYIYFYFDWNWPSADQEFKRAITLAPGIARSHRWYAAYLAAIGRNAQAMEEAERAVELDPLSVDAHDGLAKTADAAGQYSVALTESEKVLQLDPGNPIGYADLSLIHCNKAEFEAAVDDAEKGLATTHRDPAFLGMAAMAQGHLGHITEAKNLVTEMKSDATRRYVSPLFFAAAFASMGEEKEAMDALEGGYKTHDGDMVNIRGHEFDRLHSDLRFQALLRKMNFPQ